MKYIGIDPGQTGAMAIIIPNGPCTVEDWSDTIFTSLPIFTGDVLAAIEAVHSMPGQGVSSSFKFGMLYGKWLGYLEKAHINYYKVTPQKWKKHFGLIGKEKDASRVKAIELFPEVGHRLSRKKDHGRADALLIARYAKETWNE